MELDQGFYGSPRWTYEILDCAMPMTFDTYSNCAHQCLYCFSFFQRAIGSSADDYLHHKVRAVNVEKIKKMFLEPDKYAGQFASYIKKRMTMQWGGLSDGFDWYEKKFGKSLELLRFFKEINYPVSISTKGVWFLDDPRYQEVLRDAKNVHFKYSIITTNEQHVKELEPGVVSSAERFLALKKLGDLGIGGTTLRFRPFVLGTSDLCIEEMMAAGEEANCYSVTTEFLSWESRASVTSRSRLEAMSKTLGYDVWKFYLENSARASGLLRLNYDLKRPYILKMKESAERHNLKFFVSDAHHKEDSYHAGCCGLPESGPLSNVNRGQYAEAILIAKKNGFVKWSDISEEAFEVLGHIPVISAEGFPSDTAERAKRYYQNMFDYMHDIWNNPIGWQSPARYFGGALVPSAPDANGDIVYLYNKPFVEDNRRVNSVSELAIELKMVGSPNADRFDNITADGSQYAHIAYPIYVFSKGRHNSATTMKLLDAARINYSLVILNEELQQYQSKYPNTDILTVSEPGILFARKTIYDRAKEEGYPYIWMLDDDISSFKNEESEVCSPRAALSVMERFVGDYNNIAVLSMANDELIPEKYIVNSSLLRNSVYLVNLLTGISFDEITTEVLEMTSFAMANITKGFTTVLHNSFSYQESIALSGGCTSLYFSGEQEKSVLQILEKYPEYFISVDRPKPFVVDLGEVSRSSNALQSYAAYELTSGKEDGDGAVAFEDIGEI
jgi:DNA repair photolyase